MHCGHCEDIAELDALRVRVEDLEAAGKLAFVALSHCHEYTFGGQNYMSYSVSEVEDAIEALGKAGVTS